MPTVFRAGPYRFFFYASDRDEPYHIHVERDDKVAKYWLDPIRLQNSGGFNRLESLRVHSPRLAAFVVIPAEAVRLRRTGKWTGFRVKHGMTFDTPLLAAG